jgi:hypothetical protein
LAAMDREVRRGAMDDGEEDVAGAWELLLHAMDMELGGPGKNGAHAMAGEHLLQGSSAMEQKGRGCPARWSLGKAGRRDEEGVGCCRVP